MDGCVQWVHRHVLCCFSNEEECLMTMKAMCVLCDVGCCGWSAHAGCRVSLSGVCVACV